MTGPQGETGVQGPIGLTGPQGDKGEAGARGPIGLTGPQGEKGDKGETGVQGPIGLTGPQGEKGDTGAKGPIGLTGPQGDKGDKGDTGAQGPIGLTGPQGDKGDKGDTGAQGPIGLTGPKGDKGDKGDSGTQGPIGLTGPQGNKGDKGETGAQGPIGLTGPQGDKGDKGDTGIQGPIGLTGPQGDKGEKGDKGDTGDKGEFPKGTIKGEMNYWDGTSWVTIRPGTSGQILTFCNGMPTWTLSGNCPDLNPPTTGAGPTITDVDGNTYKTVYIGAQLWMGENLKTTKYNDGTPITKLGSNYFSALDNYNGAYTFYDDDNALQDAYGKMYDLKAARNAKLCPSGWHVPTDAEWKTLSEYTGGENVAGGKLKSVGTSHWNSPNTDATNAVQFSALGGGNVSSSGAIAKGLNSFWWTSSVVDATTNKCRSVHYSTANFLSQNANNQSGMYVRCLRDQDPSIPALQGSIQSLNCQDVGSQFTMLTIVKDVISPDRPFQLPYSGGNGGTHQGFTVNSTGVTGLTISSQSGTIANGNGVFECVLTGTATSTGTASFLINIGGKTCTLTKQVVMPTGYVNEILCGSATMSGTAIVNQPLSNVQVSIPYTGGNAGGFDEKQAGSSMPNGDLTAVLNQGVLAQGNGNLVFNISGTPTMQGSYQFTLYTNSFFNSGSMTGEVKTCYFSVNVSLPPAVVSSFACESVLLSGSLKEGETISAPQENNGMPGPGGPGGMSNTVSSTLSYTGGNGGSYSAQTIASTGVTGLTAALSAGNVMNGNGTLNFQIYGTPVGNGDAVFTVDLGGKTCVFKFPVTAQTPSVATITSLNCSSATHTGTLTANTSASGVSSEVPYQGGNGGMHTGQTVSSTGVVGLTATLQAGNFVNGDGNLTYTITGMPTSSGTATFELNMGGKTCMLTRTVDAAIQLVGSYGPTITDIEGNSYKTVIIGTQEWMAENLKTTKFNDGTSISYGGNTPGGILPRTNSNGIYGNVYNQGVVNITANDNKNVCPIGWHVPSQEEWNVLINYLGGELVAGGKLKESGTNNWKSPNKDATNSSLFSALPGGRESSSNPIIGEAGFWWSSTSTNMIFTNQALYLNYNYSDASFMAVGNNDGISIRCLKDQTTSSQQPQGTIQSLNCSSATHTGTLTANTSVSGVSSEVPYQGGNGGMYTGQTINSTGVTGLTASLQAGNFVNGDATLTYSISGTPTSSGTATFELNIGGKTCALTRTVDAFVGIISTLNCANTTNNGSLIATVVSSGVSSVVSYTGGNGGPHPGQTVASSGVTGLTATLQAGNFANGDGTLTYTIAGTPASSGTASFDLNIGGKTCALSVNVATGSINSINCSTAQNSGTLGISVSATYVSSSIPFTGGNGGPHSGQIVTSTGVEGLTATLQAGKFYKGDGYLNYTITGTPTSIGIANFEINIAGKTCILTRTVNPNSGYGPDISDIEGNTYKTAYIGSQHWMTENLKVTKYNNGTTIDGYGAWEHVNRDSQNNSKYGKLYNGFVAQMQVCPTGWHIPNNQEWDILTEYLGGETIAGGKMKEVSITSWKNPNTDATNTSLFTGLPAASGTAYSTGVFGEQGYWYSSNTWCVPYIEPGFMYIEGSAYYLSYDSASFKSRKWRDLGVGPTYSIRCIKD